MTNQVITSDEHVTLMLDAAAWRIEITLTPKSGVVIGCAHYVITQNYGAALSEEFVVRDSDGNIDYDSRYTDGDPFTAAIDVWGCSLLDESKSYHIALSYDIYENGVLTAEKVVIGLNVNTVSRQESGESGMGAELPVEYISAFPGKGTCTFNIAVSKRYYNGGLILINAQVHGITSGRSQTYTQNNMYYTEVQATDEYGDSYTRAFYTLAVSKDDIGYGKCDIQVDVTYKTGQNEYNSTGSTVGKIPFSFLYLESGSKFRITAAEWNEFIHLLTNEAIRHGSASLTLPEDKVRGDRFTISDIAAARDLFAVLKACGVNGMPEEREIPAGTMSFGKRPVLGLSAFELFSKFENWISESMES